MHSLLDVDVLRSGYSRKNSLAERHLGELVVVARAQRAAQVLFDLHGVGRARYVALHELNGLEEGRPLLPSLKHQIHVEAGLKEEHQHDLVVEVAHLADLVGEVLVRQQEQQTRGDVAPTFLIDGLTNGANELRILLRRVDWEAW